MALRGTWRAALFGLCAALAVSAGRAEPGYPPVLPGRVLRFPDDGGAHPQFRTEWWYVTGWISDAQGVERGFQVTFFRVRPGIGEDNPSRFAPRQLVLAHAAIADPSAGRLQHAERSERALDPVAGAATGQTNVWARDWRLEWRGDHYGSRVEADAFAFDLRFDPASAPVLNGSDGFSQKAGDPKYASYYYSRPQLAVTGSLRVGEATVPVTGRAWLDHEWSSELMPRGARGWDWIGINLHDGGSLMAFRMRDERGGAIWTAGTLRTAQGETRALRAGQVAFTPLRRWRSPRTGAEYAVEWAIDIDGRRMQVRPLMDDQELDSRRSTGAVYWEGAVRLFESGREIGRGYLEMTGYAERLRM